MICLGIRVGMNGSFQENEGLGTEVSRLDPKTRLEKVATQLELGSPYYDINA